MENLEFLKALSSAVAPSGREGAVAALVREKIEPFCDEIFTDKIGNLIAKIKPSDSGEYKKTMISAHMDEVGFMIKSIDGDGRLRILPLGKYDSRVLSGKKVVFTKPVMGLVASKAIHQQSRAERSVPMAMDKLYVELGTKNKEETEAHLALGDFGTFAPKFVRLGERSYAGKALGGRTAVALLCEIVSAVKAKKDAGTLTEEYDFVFSVKREIGGREFAISTAAYTLAPDTAIVIEAIPAADFGKSENVKCGDGVALVPADARTIYDRELFAKTVALCEKEGIKFQYARLVPMLGNEAGSVHRTRAGIPTETVGIPVRNLHSGAEIVFDSDVDAARALLLAKVNLD